MKEDFNRHQDQSYFNRWRNSYAFSNEHFTFRASCSDKLEIQDLGYRYESTLIRKKFQPMLITDKTLPSLLAMSAEQTHIVLNAKSFYIKDIRNVKESPFNTIVFQIDEPPLVSTEDSKTIMERYFHEKPLNYEMVQSIGKGLSYSDDCPFISGYEMYAPEMSSSKDPTCWYALHQILSAVENKTSGCMHLMFRCHHEIPLAISAHHFSEQVKRASAISQIQEMAVSEMMHLYHNPSRCPNIDDLHVVEKYLLEQRFTDHSLSLKKILQLMTYYRIDDKLTEVFGKDHPHLAEVREKLQQDMTEGNEN